MNFCFSKLFKLHWINIVLPVQYAIVSPSFHCLQLKNKETNYFILSATFPSRSGKKYLGRFLLGTLQLSIFLSGVFRSTFADKMVVYSSLNGFVCSLSGAKFKWIIKRWINLFSSLLFVLCCSSFPGVLFFWQLTLASFLSNAAFGVYLFCSIEI